jgi:hypothetical protein
MLGLHASALDASHTAALRGRVTLDNASPPAAFLASAVTWTKEEAPGAARATDVACTARTNESRAAEVAKAKHCSGTPGVAGNDTDMTCGLPSRTTALHAQPAMGMAVFPSQILPPPSALLTALSAVLPYAKKLLVIVIDTVSHFLNNALAS